ncbi:hypothetical protein D3C76_1288230 [compost metagenome]
MHARYILTVTGIITFTLPNQELMRVHRGGHPVRGHLGVLNRHFVLDAPFAGVVLLHQIIRRRHPETHIDRVQVEGEHLRLVGFVQ